VNFASALRNQLAESALKYAKAHAVRHALSYGEMPAVCFPAEDDDSSHGNFLQGSYKAILSKPGWRRRLAKVHTLGRRSLPATAEGGWKELDSCNSSDALLMNIFCHPGITRDEGTLAALGLAAGGEPIFGYRARVPLTNGRVDRTEVDMKLGCLLVEAKLTEGDFRKAEKRVLAEYRDFDEVFDRDELPQTESHYLSYQLLRNVLAAYALQGSFCVLLDARRPDLMEAWYAVMRCVKPVALRTALRVMTWQELARALPPRLQLFLAVKYGIYAGASGIHAQDYAIAGD
jgi:hypothetical protein